MSASGRLRITTTFDVYRPNRQLLGLQGFRTRQVCVNGARDRLPEPQASCEMLKGCRQELSNMTRVTL